MSKKQEQFEFRPGQPPLVKEVVDKRELELYGYAHLFWPFREFPIGQIIPTFFLIPQFGFMLNRKSGQLKITFDWLFLNSGVVFKVIKYIKMVPYYED